jgi:hypothetical protein
LAITERKNKMLKNRIVFIILTAFTVVLSGFWVLADTNLKVFKAGDPIKADEVNANFQSLASALPVKFTVVITKDNDNIACVQIDASNKDCNYFIDHPALNGKPDVWLEVRGNCELIISDRDEWGCEKESFTNIEDKYPPYEVSAYYDETTQRWYLEDVGFEFYITDIGYRVEQIGYNILVIP